MKFRTRDDYGSEFSVHRLVSDICEQDHPVTDRYHIDS